MPSNKSVVGSSDHHRRPPSKEGDNYAPPSSVLWVGNVPAKTVDTDVITVFSKFGALDCNTMHGAGSYSFVFFRSVDDAKAAKDALQGSRLSGNSIKIEFARPVFPSPSCNLIWILRRLMEKRICFPCLCVTYVLIAWADGGDDSKTEF